jgi:uncharacterized delta-60 repeat protein
MPHTLRTQSLHVRARIEALEPRQLLAAGALDPSFSGDGKATIDFGLDQAEPYRFFPVDVAVTADGKTVVAGTFAPATPNTPGSREFAVARFNLDGTLDRSFNANTNHPGLAFAHPADYPKDEFVSAVAIQPDGKIVVVGESLMHAFGTVGDFFAFAIVRFNVDGSHDSSFSGNGVLNIDFGDFASARNVLVQPDGKIVVVGTMDSGDELDYAMVRLNPNGDLDSSFNSDGKKSLFISGDDVATAVAIDSLGNYVLVGSSTSGGITRLSAVRIKRDGPLDTTFDGDGRFLLSVPGHKYIEARDLLIQGNKVVVVGEADGETGDIEEPHQSTVLRLNFEGTVDTTFGTNFTGIVHTPGLFSANSIIPSADGGLIVGGSGGSGPSGGGSGLAAYNANGVLNTGLVFTDFGATVFGLAKGLGRRFVAVGNLSKIARYLDTGANVVSIGALDGLAGEGTTNTGLLAVGRLERLPFPTRVYISIGGTAVGRTPALAGTLDYTLDKVVQPLPSFGSPNPRPYVDIPANETFVFVTLATLNDSRIEGNESAVFSIIPDASYEIGTPSTGTVTITDDDRLIFTLGTSTVTPPPKHVEEEQEVQTAVTWTVPSGGWRQLSSIQLRLRDLDDDDALVLLSFDEATNSFSMDATAAAAGAVALVPEKSTFAAAGPTAPRVTVTFTYRFNAAAAAHRFALDVSADNDAGDASGFSEVAKVFVRKKPKKDHARDVVLLP